MSIELNFKGYSQTHDVKGGEGSPLVFYDGYPSPYPIKFPGLLLKKALSTAYDATATPTYPVVIPCGNGERPVGYAFVDTANTALFGSYELLAAADRWLPKVADRTGGGSTYTQDKNKFVAVPTTPLIPGQVIGVPVAASTSFTINDEVASAALGFAEVATTGDVVIGTAEIIVDNSTGAAGAAFVWVKVGHQYTKA